MKKYLFLFLLFPSLLFAATQFNANATDSNGLILPPLALDTTRTFKIIIYAKIKHTSINALFVMRDTTTSYGGFLETATSPKMIFWEWSGNGSGQQYKVSRTYDTTNYHFYVLAHQGNGGGGKIDTAYTHIYIDNNNRDSAISGWGPSGSLGTIPATTTNNNFGREMYSPKQGKGRYYAQMNVICAWIDTGKVFTQDWLNDIVAHKGNMQYYKQLPGYCMGWNFQGYYADGANVTTAPGWGGAAWNATVKTDNGTPVYPTSTAGPQVNLITDPGGIK